MPTVTRPMIVKELRRLGVKPGDILMVHSALSSFGKVAGGAKAVVDALLDTVGPQGTLLMPSLVAARPYDFRTSPSAMGAISEEFRRRPGVQRSLNPCVPACALGPRAVEFLRDHHRARCPYIGSPYDLAARAGGYVLLLGVDQDRNTTLHCAEALAGLPYLTGGAVPYVDEKGKTQTYKYVLGAGPHRDFIGVDPLLREAGVLKLGRIGGCVARLMKGREMLDLLVRELKKDPALFLTKNEGYFDGVMQRGRIRAAELAERERFRLIVRSSSAGRTLEEVLWYAQRAGAQGIEFDVINGLDAAGNVPEKAAVYPATAYSAEELAALRARVEKRGLRVCVVRCIALANPGFEATLRAAKALGAGAVLHPLTGAPALLKARAAEARKAGLRMLYENVAISSKAAAELMDKLPSAAFAFNPANFAAAGEMPFLQSYKSHVKKHISYLAVSDMRPLGVPCLPGCGNAEVKELISILRCSSFDGFLSIGHGCGGNLDFAKTTDAFFDLLAGC